MIPALTATYPAWATRIQTALSTRLAAASQPIARCLGSDRRPGRACHTAYATRPR